LFYIYRGEIKRNREWTPKNAKGSDGVRLTGET